MKKSHEGGRGLRMALARLMSVPSGCFDGVPYLELHGDATLHVTGYESLLLYDDDNILLRMKPSPLHYDTLRITGKGLTLSVVREGCLSVGGRIGEIRFGGGRTGGGETV